MKLARIGIVFVVLVALIATIVFLTRKPPPPEVKTQELPQKADEDHGETPEWNFPSDQGAPPKVERDPSAERDANVKIIMADLKQHIERRADDCGWVGEAPAAQRRREQSKERAARAYEQHLRDSFSDDELSELAKSLKDPLLQRVRRFANDDISEIESHGGWPKYDELQNGFVDSLGGWDKYLELQPHFHIDTLPFAFEKKAALNEAVDATMAAMEQRALFEKAGYSRFAKNSQLRDDRMRVTLSMAMAFGDESAEKVEQLAKALSLPAVQRELLELMNFSHDLCKRFITPPAR